MTLKYGNVYFVVRLDNSNFSSEVKIMLYGLFLGMGDLLGYHHAINRNIFQDYIRYRIYEKYHLAEWQEHDYDKDSLIADPMFINPAKNDYRVKPESPALKLGFKNFEMGKWGLTDEFPKMWREKRVTKK